MSERLAKKILILGGYGNFGRRLALSLAKSNISIVIAGRNQQAAHRLCEQIKKKIIDAVIDVAIFDVDKDLLSQLKKLKPHVVINTCGPFQKKDYSVALACLRYKAHYIDLADARDFVCDITRLDQQAKQAGIAIVSGASTVPGLSSAVLDSFKEEFKHINSLTYGISPGQMADRGLATTESILSYLGKPLKPAYGSNQQRYGWQDIYRQSYPLIGGRWMANCDIPDLDLLPRHYKIDTIRFSAGMESKCLHFGIWLISWLVRFKLPINLMKHAKILLTFSHCFDRFGTADGGMHMMIKGEDHDHQPKIIKWFIVARDGHGPEIPIVPAIILAKQLLQDEPPRFLGAQPCVGLVTLDDYLNELSSFNITTHVERLEAKTSH